MGNARPTMEDFLLDISDTVWPEFVPIDMPKRVPRYKKRSEDEVDLELFFTKDQWDYLSDFVHDTLHARGLPVIDGKKVCYLPTDYAHIMSEVVEKVMSDPNSVPILVRDIASLEITPEH
jgi:hypothetical protein